MYGYVFFFKQKTAYEMRISDWSSDVCSSDLTVDGARSVDKAGRAAACAPARGPFPRPFLQERMVAEPQIIIAGKIGEEPPFSPHAGSALGVCRLEDTPVPPCGRSRSEEPTSELQSLMRISSAVLGLKNKN